MFGHYYRSVDDKNRISVPPKIREELGNLCYATIGPDNVLEIRNENDFNIFKDKLLSPNMLNANARKFARILLANTVEVEFDNSGRMKLPPSFMDRLKIDKEVAFLGVGNKVELWAKEKFDGFQSENEVEGSLDELAQKLLKDGINI